MTSGSTSGATVLADLLDGYGVSHVFHVPAILRRTMAEIEQRTSIRRISPHGEKPAAYMADGFARTTGRPGICMAQAVGALNLAAGLRDAHLAHSPVIAFTGGRVETPYRGVYQEVDDRPAFENITKMNAAVDTVEQIPETIRQAFRVAVSDCPGPVHVQFAGNEGQVDVEEAAIEAVIDHEFASVPPFRPQPQETDLRRALELLETATRPVIVAGGGVRASGAGPTLVELAERLAVPIATSLNGKDVIEGSHSLSVGVVGSYSRSSANRIVAECDLVCFVGTSTGGMTTHLWQVPPVGTPAVQIDIDRDTIGRNYPVAVGVVGDARVALQWLAAASDRGTSERRSAWCARAAAAGSDWQDENSIHLRSDAVPIRPERLCAELTDLVPDDVIVVVDTGHAGMWMGGMYDLRTSTQSYLRSAGHLGWAFPAALGAKCGVPERPVLCFTGDAGLWYHLAELETAVRFGINTVTVVNNNRSGNQSKRGFDRAYGGEQTDAARELWMFTDVDFARIAEDVGVHGIRVERPDQIGPALEEAFSADGPVLIDVVTDIDALAPLAVTV